MKDLNEIKAFVKELIVDVMEYEDMSADQIKDDAPFFGTEDEPGLIHDSLAILEIATRLGEEYDIMPEDFTEDAFTDVNTLSVLIHEKINIQA